MKKEIQTFSCFLKEKEEGIDIVTERNENRIKHREYANV
jgi:hypothetical protein